MLARFRGTILQTPPPFSAKKIAGTPAYRLARKHIAVELEPVEVQVFALDLVEFDGTTARIRVRCSAGTYLRGIAHDVGQQLGCGAFLTALRRTASGEFTESQARTLEALEELARGRSVGPGADSGRAGTAGDSERDRGCAHRRPNPAWQGFPAVAVRGKGRCEVRKGGQSRKAI